MTKAPKDTKICLVTGANSGIGRQTAWQLALSGARVLLVCRSPEKGNAAREEMMAGTGNKNIELLICDLSSLKQIKELADAVLKTCDHLDILINNAGGFFMNRQQSADGFEMTFAVNYLAPFYLTHLLLPLVLAAPQGRIINLSSTTQTMIRKIDWDDLQYATRRYKALQAYAQSKLLIIIFSQELARKLTNTPVTVNAVHPGGVATALGTNDNNLFYKIFWKLASLTFTSAEKGAETSVYLATSAEGGRISGKYWSNKAISKVNPIAEEPGIGEKLWNITGKLITGKGIPF